MSWNWSECNKWLLRKHSFYFLLSWRQAWPLTKNCTHVFTYRKAILLARVSVSLGSEKVHTQHTLSCIKVAMVLRLLSGLTALNKLPPIQCIHRTDSHTLLSPTCRAHRVTGFSKFTFPCLHTTPSCPLIPHVLACWLRPLSTAHMDDTDSWLHPWGSLICVFSYVHRSTPLFASGWKSHWF